MTSSFGDNAASRLTQNVSFDYDTYDEYGAFGASDASRDEEKGKDHIESLSNEVMLEAFVKGTNENDDHNARSSCTTRANSPLLTRRFDTPMEVCHSPLLRPLSFAALTSRPSGEPHSAPENGDEETLPNSGWTLADHQVSGCTSGPSFSSVPYGERANAPAYGEAETDEPDCRTQPTLTSSGSNLSDSPPLPITPLDGTREAGDTCAQTPKRAVVISPSSCEAKARERRVTEETHRSSGSRGSSAEEDLNQGAPQNAGLDMDDHTMSESCHGDAAPGRASTARSEADTDMLSAERLSLPFKAKGKRKAITFDLEPEEFPTGTTIKREEVVDLPLSPESTFAPSPLTTILGIGESEAANLTPDPRPSKKGKRTPLGDSPRARGTTHPTKKLFRLLGNDGRPDGHGNYRTKEFVVEGISCTHLAGTSGLCQFVGPDDASKCFLDLPKDPEAVRAHLSMHMSRLGWARRHRNDPHWNPTCPWCDKDQTMYRQLMRHIVNSHLLMFKEWCPCGGSNSRSNQRANKGRHEDSEMHRAYLRELAQEEAAREREAWEVEDCPDETAQEEEWEGEEEEEASEVQPEFVQGSSRGIKRWGMR